MADFPPRILEAVEGHWAVRAFPPADRARALALAQDEWTRLTSHAALGASAGSAEALAHDDPLVSGLANAYERAALECAVALESATEPEPRGALIAELEAAAHRAFTLARILAPPLRPAVYHSYHLLKVAAIASVAGAAWQIDRWLAAIAADTRIPRATPPSPGGYDDLRPGDELVVSEMFSEAPSDDDPPRWDIDLRRRLQEIWLDILRGPTANGLAHAFEALGALREARVSREVEYVASLPLVAVQQMRLHLFALYCAADAAVAITMHFRRGPYGETAAVVADCFDKARRVSGADLAFDDALQWLSLASQQIATRHNVQLELPNLLV